MKRKPTHSNTRKSQDGDKNKDKILKIASALSSVIASDAEENERKTCVWILKGTEMLLHLTIIILYTYY